MIAPTLDGQPVLGAACAVIPAVSHPRDNIHADFGFDGLYGVDPLRMELETHVAGDLAGPGPAGLALAVGALRAMHDGRARTLMDSLGQVWPSVLVGPVELHGRAIQSADGTYHQSFTVTLTHLSPPTS